MAALSTVPAIAAALRMHSGSDAGLLAMCKEWHAMARRNKRNEKRTGALVDIAEANTLRGKLFRASHPDRERFVREVGQATSSRRRAKPT
jgi:hypothetical protein